MNIVYSAATTLIFFMAPLFSGQEKSSACSEEGLSRKKMLEQWDEAMAWIMPFSSRTFVVSDSLSSEIFKHKDITLETFVQLHGYFSCHKPLVGLVTEDPKDVEPIQKVLKALQKAKKVKWAELATYEILCKALAYRNLKTGDRLWVPLLQKKRLSLIEYRVDEVLDLWQGMPAFGFKPVNKGAPAFLLFRGTDLSLTSKSSWASVLSDLDFDGAGFSTFQGAQEKIHSWLERASSSGIKPKVMGFSLGGVLAIYTTLFETSLIERCIAFNAPGVSKANFQRWEEQSDTYPILSFATQGDLVARIGKMVGEAKELSDRASMGPIEAHTKLMSASSPLLVFPINIYKENMARTQGE